MSAKQKMKSKIQKTFLQSDITSSSCTGPELYYFLNFDYHAVESDCSALEEATVDELLEEAFQFIMPDGVPEYFKHFTCNKRSWKAASQLMYNEFYKKDIVNWQILNHKLDYRTTSFADIVKQREQMVDALNFNDVSDDENGVENYKQSKLHLTGLAMLELHSLLALLKNDRVSGINEANTERHDNVKGVMYSIFNLWDLGCRVNGQSMFSLPQIGRLSKQMTTFISKPDTTLYAVDSGKIAVVHSRFGVHYNFYPYLVMEVYEPICDTDVTADLSDDSTPHVTDSDSDSNESLDQVTPRLKRVTVSLQTSSKLRKSIENQVDFYEDEHKPTRKAVRKIIAEESPFSATTEMQPALKKSTGQLPMEMYGNLYEKMMMKNTLTDLTVGGTSQALGIFVINEKIYFEKIIENNHIIKDIIEKTQRPSGIKIQQKGPAIYLAQWCFDLKIPNHRIAFQAFLHYMQKITLAELKSMQKE